MPDNASYDQSVYLSFADIALDNLKNPTVLQVCIKQSKTDHFGKGVTLYVARTGMDLCPVAAVLSYLELRGCRLRPLFLFQRWKPLTRPRFVAVVREALGKSGLDERKYCSHGFRTGAATTAASRGELHYINTGPLGECGVPAICLYSARATGIHLWSVGHLGTRPGLCCTC